MSHDAEVTMNMGCMCHVTCDDMDDKYAMQVSVAHLPAMTARCVRALYKCISGDFTRVKFCTLHMDALK